MGGLDDGRTSSGSTTAFSNFSFARVFLAGTQPVSSLLVQAGERRNVRIFPKSSGESSPRTANQSELHRRGIREGDGRRQMPRALTINQFARATIMDAAEPIPEDLETGGFLPMWLLGLLGV